MRACRSSRRGWMHVSRVQPQVDDAQVNSADCRLENHWSRFHARLDAISPLQYGLTLAISPLVASNQPFLRREIDYNS